MNVTSFNKFLKQYKEEINIDDFYDERKIYNLRCFFSLLTHHPGLMWIIKPLLNLPFKKLFWTVGNILDGYYLRKGIAYQQKPTEFIASIFHFLTHYRNSLKLSKDNT